MTNMLLVIVNTFFGEIEMLTSKILAWLINKLYTL